MILNNDKLGGEHPVFCRCRCGQETARVKVQPGSKLKSIYNGFITGHENRRPRGIVTPDEMAQRRRAELRVNTAIALGLIGKRVGFTKSRKRPGSREG